MDVFYIFSWKIKPTNSMQSIACIMVIYARRLLSVSGKGQKKASIRCIILVWFGFNTHTFLLPIFVIRKKGFRSTSGLYVSRKNWRCFPSYFSLLDPRCSDYYTCFCFARFVLYYTHK